MSDEVILKSYFLFCLETAFLTIDLKLDKLHFPSLPFKVYLRLRNNITRRSFITFPFLLQSDAFRNEYFRWFKECGGFSSNDLFYIHLSYRNWKPINNLPKLKNPVSAGKEWVMKIIKIAYIISLQFRYFTLPGASLVMKMIMMTKMRMAHWRNQWEQVIEISYSL